MSAHDHGSIPAIRACAICSPDAPLIDAQAVPDRLSDSTRMVGALCYGCGKAGTKRRPVTQRDLGSPVKWHGNCYSSTPEGLRP